ncbi:lipid IV(A) 3-deoxy-D-manno-octulosonic acid transferase [Shewanella dokdonensis]|uniref:lipid IV(A) 3-deoxy-D-manno-octulosonic acid transferase n=1 Tax=Shewanella dokdonensis TaxID=712036 RepID=UPI00200E65F0|nr:lipid IV(A) 3-deoxy-D-manno-octulosonic acid transferase [Shewanella dokdonensis]MCL1075566.1 lipid IV(A) 3-deoxy-D-manno-octulosonic acid transferase [Shewanella dokdonensis]
MNLRYYSILLYLLTPLLLLYLVFRALKSADYRSRWGERFGLSKLNHSDILIHCVSMGETLAALPMIRLLQQQRPDLSITVTSTSPTGSREVIKALGHSVQHQYLPFDLPWCIRRFLKQLQPQLVIIMETELWPNLLHQAKQQGAQLLLANARLSAKSAANYHQWPKLSRPMLQLLDRIAVQTATEAQRFIDLGVMPSQVQVCGNLKFDLQLDENKIAAAKQQRQQWGRQASPVWVAGSVHPGEFATMLDCHKTLLQQWPQALLIMVPRHPEQFDNAAEAIQRSGLRFVRRSQKGAITSDTQVLLADTMGELLTLYGCADTAFVGGTLIPNGGHNPLEPAALGLPVLEGPNHRDFKEISGLLVDAGAMQIVADAAQLAAAIQGLWSDTAHWQQASRASLAVVAANKGALVRQSTLVLQLLAGIKSAD